MESKLSVISALPFHTSHTRSENHRKIFRLHPNPTEKSIRWRKRQSLITFLVHQYFHFSSEPLGCHFLSLLLRLAATINPSRELFS